VHFQFCVNSFVILSWSCCDCVISQLGVWWISWQKARTWHASQCLARSAIRSPFSRCACLIMSLACFLFTYFRRYVFMLCSFFLSFFLFFFFVSFSFFLSFFLFRFLFVFCLLKQLFLSSPLRAES
jgi:hypothetical protein